MNLNPVKNPVKPVRKNHQAPLKRSTTTTASTSLQDPSAPPPPPPLIRKQRIFGTTRCPNIPSKPSTLDKPAVKPKISAKKSPEPAAVRSKPDTKTITDSRKDKENISVPPPRNKVKISAPPPRKNTAKFDKIVKVTSSVDGPSTLTVRSKPETNNNVKKEKAKISPPPPRKNPENLETLSADGPGTPIEQPLSPVASKPGSETNNHPSKDEEKISSPLPIHSPENLEKAVEVTQSEDTLNTPTEPISLPDTEISDNLKENVSAAVPTVKLEQAVEVIRSEDAPNTPAELPDVISKLDPEISDHLKEKVSAAAPPREDQVESEYVVEVIRSENSPSNLESDTTINNINENPVNFEPAVVEVTLSKDGPNTPTEPPLDSETTDNNKKKKKDQAREVVKATGTEQGPPNTPTTAPRTKTPRVRVRGTPTPFHTAIGCRKSKFEDELETASYWLVQIRTAEAVGKHSVSASFFRLAAECKAQPEGGLRAELKRYLKRYQHLRAEEEWKLACRTYGVI